MLIYYITGQETLSSPGKQRGSISCIRVVLSRTFEKERQRKKLLSIDGASSVCLQFIIIKVWFLLLLLCVIYTEGASATMPQISALVIIVLAMTSFLGCYGDSNLTEESGECLISVFRCGKVSWLLFLLITSAGKDSNSPIPHTSWVPGSFVWNAYVPDYLYELCNSRSVFVWLHNEQVFKMKSQVQC